MSKGGRYLKKPVKKPASKGKKILGIFLGILVALILVAGIAGVVLYNYVLGNINRAEVVEQDYTMTPEIENMMGVIETEATTEATEEATTEATTVATEPLQPDMLNVLVVGQSAREGEESRLADTLILVTINKNTKDVTLTSFLRDAYVKLPDYMGHTCGWNRINTAYALGYVWGGTGGAMEMTNLCLRNNFGIEVDGNIEVNFEAFKKVIDVLGGIRIKLTEAEANYLNEDGKAFQEVTVGENYLMGDAALAYARMRKAEGDSDSDIKRTARQRYVIEAVFEKLKYKRLSSLQSLVDEILPMITTNMTDAQITEYLVDVLPLVSGMTIKTGTGPVSNDVLKGSQWGDEKDLPDGRAWIIAFDRGKNTEYFRNLTEGLTPEDPAATAPAGN